MARLIKSFTEPSGISDFFGVADEGVVKGDFGDQPTIWHLGQPADEWMEAGPNAVTFNVGYEAKSYVRYELWDARPPAADPSWQSWEGRIYLASGRIVAVGYGDEAEYYTSFDLGSQDKNWWVRISGKTPVNDTDPEFPRDIYRGSMFKLQFWVAGA